MNVRTVPSSRPAFALALLAAAAPVVPSPALFAQEGASEYGTRTIYALPADGSAGGGSYPRVVRLQHHPEARGHLLATFERRPHLAIYRSTDDGDTWHPFSEVDGLRWPPNFFELPQQVGEFPAGTLYLAGMQTSTAASGRHPPFHGD